jgi:hypothetical protein
MAQLRRARPNAWLWTRSRQHGLGNNPDDQKLGFNPESTMSPASPTTRGGLKAIGGDWENEHLTRPNRKIYGVMARWTLAY